MKKDMNVDKVIKDTLITRSTEINEPTYLFNNIVNQIKSTSQNYDRKMIKLNKPIYFASSFLIALIMMFTFSSNFRTYAEGSYLRIKTLFTIQKDNNGYEIVEVDAKNLYSTVAQKRKVDLNDLELSKKYGFQISFPNTINKVHKLEHKEVSILIKNKIIIQTFEELKKEMLSAIDEPANYLQNYNTFYIVSGYYNQDLQNGFSISLSKASEDIIHEKFSTQKYEYIKIDNLNAYWLEVPYPVFSKGSKVTDKPSDIKVSHILYWQKDGISYTLSPTYKSEMTKDTYIKNATEYIREIQK